MTSVATDAPIEDRAAAQSSPDALLAERVAATPRAVAVLRKRHGIWHPTTFAELDAAVGRCAAALAACGVRPGARVGIVGDPGLEWLVADLAAQRLGAAAIAGYPTAHADDLVRLLAGAQVVFCADEELADGLGAVGAQELVLLDPRGMSATERGFEAFLARGGDELLAADPAAAAQALLGAPTAGTTGPPRVALLRPSAVAELARSAASWAGLRRGDRNLVHVPSAQAAARVLDLYAPLAAGSTICFPETADSVPDDLVEIAPTVLATTARGLELLRADVEAHLRRSHRLKSRVQRLAARLREGGRGSRLAAHWLADRWIVRRLGLGRARRVVACGSAVAPELAEYFERLGVPVVAVYGQSETGGIACAQDGPADRATAGRPLPGVEARREPDGAIALRTAALCVGYLDARGPEPADGGWYRTDDVGGIDAEGRVVLSVRRHDVAVLAGGEEVSLAEVEAGLRGIAYVEQAVAIADGRPHVTALVQLDQTAITEWALQRDIPFTSYRSLATHGEVAALVAAEVEAVNERLAPELRVRAHRLLERPFAADPREVTPARTPRRGVVAEHHADAIEELYRA